MLFIGGKMIANMLGLSGSGKTTLKKGLILKYPPLYKVLVSYTTRPKRFGETNGVEYNFVSDKYFEENKLELKRNIGDGYVYGVDIKDFYSKERKILLTSFNVAGICKIEEWKMQIVVFFLDVPAHICKKRLLNRGGYLGP